MLLAVPLAALIYVLVPTSLFLYLPLPAAVVALLGYLLFLSAIYKLIK